MTSAYADAATVRQRAGLTSTDLNVADDATLTALIVSLNNRVSDAIERYCRRDFQDHANVTEAYDGTDTDTLILRGWPVRSITSVTISGVLLAATEYRLRPVTGAAEDAGLLQRKNAAWPYDWQNISIVYTWGYTAPPFLVKSVAEDIIIRVLQEAARAFKTKGASTVSLDGFTASWERLAVELTSEDKTALDAVRVSVVA